MKMNRTLMVLFGTLLLDSIGFGIVFPIIPIIFTDPLSSSFMLTGYSVSMQFFIAGAITAIFGIMQFFASPILGELSDVYGRKKLLMLGVGVLAFSQLLFGFGIQVMSITVLFIARAIAGLAAANFAVAQATIADVSAPEDRAKNFGLIGAAFGIGFILGPLLSGWLAGLSGDPAIPFFVSAALGIVNVLYLFYFLPNTKPASEDAKHHFTWLKGIHNIQAAIKDVDVRPVYLANFLYMCGFAFFTTFIGILLVNSYGASEAGVGTYFAVVGGWIVFTQAVILRVLSNKYTDKQLLKVSILAVATAIALHPFMPNMIALYVLLPILAVPQGLSFAALGSLVSRSVSAQRQGAALGINSSLMALASGIVPLIAGVGSGFIGLGAPFVIGGAIILGAWMVLFLPADA